jgi:esterase/lipase superfamily enzyme
MAESAGGMPVKSGMPSSKIRNNSCARHRGLLAASSLFLLAFSLWTLAQNAPKAASPSAAQSAQPMFFIEGSVNEHVKLQPVDGVQVELRNPTTSEVLAGTETGADGKFMLPVTGLKPGKYIVRISLTSFEDQDQPVTIAADGFAPPPISFTMHCLVPDTPPVKHSVVRVFYATDRRQGRSLVKWTDRVGYDNVPNPSGKLTLGYSDVNIPETHQPTGLEHPSLLKLEFRSNPGRHIIVDSVQPKPNDAFFKEVAKQVAASPNEDAFVFVHGYGLSFEAAVQRTAQVAYDLGFHGAPILYSWSSEGSLFGYLTDQQRVAATVDDLQAFLTELSQKSGAKTIHLIAHSMGNRALLAALLRMNGGPQKAIAAPFRDVVLAAPDVDRSQFIRDVKQLTEPNRHITLYVSSSDQLLLISQRLFHHEIRAGEAGPNIIVLPSMDTIDVTRTSIDLLGHSYYGNNRPVLRDLAHIFENQGAPRPGLQRTVAGSLAYWLLLPQ